MMERALRFLASSRGLFLAVVAAGALVGLGLSLGGGDHTVTAEFSNVNGLVSGNDVRIGGVEVGSVQSVNPNVDPQTGQQSALVTFTVDNAHWPLHKGTTIAVRPKGVLSNVYVDVIPASAGNPVLAGSPDFGLSQTQSPVNLDELSNVFDPSVRTSIRTQLQEGVLVFGGAGIGDFNQTVANLNPLTDSAIPVTAVLAQRSPQLDRLNGEFDTITGDLSREDANLRGLIANGDVLLGVLAAHEVSLQGTLVHAAGTLTTLDQGLRNEVGNLQSIFAKGPEALYQARDAATLLSPLISNVDPYIADLNVLLHEFLTATGYTTGTGNNAYGLPLDTLRVDGSLPPTNKSAVGCGGSTENHC